MPASSKKEQIFEELEESSLSESSIRGLKSKLNRLFATEPFPKNILEEVIPKINVNKNEKTELAYVSNIRTIAKNSPTFHDMIKTQLRVIEEFNKGINESITAEYNEQKKRDNDVEWEEILSVKEKIKNDADMLIYLLYTDIPTQRIDFTPMMIVKDESEVDESEADEEAINYYVKETEQFIFNSYKTANKHGQRTVDATPELADLINKLDTEWLFEDKNGNPITENALSKRITKVFTKYLGKPVGLLQVRRSQCSYEDRNEKPIKEKEEQANKRGHTDATKQKYSFKSDCKFTVFKKEHKN